MSRRRAASDPIHLPGLISEHFGLSRSEARRLISQGAVSIDGEVASVVDVEIVVHRCTLTVGKRREVDLRHVFNGVQYKAGLCEHCNELVWVYVGQTRDPLLHQSCERLLAEFESEG